VRVKTNLALVTYQRYERILESCQSALLLLIRLTWGILFMQTGWGKWQDIPKVAAFFADIGIPLPTLNACMAATTELVGGAFLALGLLSRLTPIPLIVTMIVAYVTTEHEALHSLVTGDPDPFLSAAPFLFLLASLLVLVFGPGSISLDRLIFGTKAPDGESKRNDQ
jgi:putative oxidoreductase